MSAPTLASPRSGQYLDEPPNQCREPLPLSIQPGADQPPVNATGAQTASGASIGTETSSQSSGNPSESRLDPGVFTDANGDIAVHSEQEFEKIWKQVEDFKLTLDSDCALSGTNSECSSCHSSTTSDDKNALLPRGRLKRPPGVRLAKAKNTRMLKGAQVSGGQEAAEGPPAVKPSNARAGLTGLLMMKKQVSRWRANRMQTWALGGGGSRAKTKNIPVENTYQMGPLDKKRFCKEVVERVAEKCMLRTITPNKTYDPAQAALLTRLITEEIKASIKDLNYNRYKYVVQVFLGQDMSQGVQLSSRCVWDPALDGQATAVVKSRDIFCVANVYATYFE